MIQLDAVLRVMKNVFCHSQNILSKREKKFQGVEGYAYSKAKSPDAVRK